MSGIGAGSMAVLVTLALAQSGRHPAAPPAPRRAIIAPADSYQAVVVNRVVLDIAAPATLIWSYLPGIKIRPGSERVPLNSIEAGVGAKFDMVYKDSTGTVTRHDRLDILHWEPGVRFVARVRYLPPAPPLEILYNVDLKESGGTTHFVMDSYTTLSLPVGANPAAQAAREAEQRREWQTAVEQGYDRFKREVEAAAKKQ